MTKKPYQITYEIDMESKEFKEVLESIKNKFTEITATVLDVIFCCSWSRSIQGLSFSKSTSTGRAPANRIALTTSGQEYAGITTSDVLAPFFFILANIATASALVPES